MLKYMPPHVRKHSNSRNFFGDKVAKIKTAFAVYTCNAALYSSQI
jgi:hypothetical protein